MAWKPAECRIEESGADCGGEAGGEIFETNLDGVGRVKGGELQWEEVEWAIEVHASDEGDDVGRCDDALTCK